MAIKPSKDTAMENNQKMQLRIIAAIKKNSGLIGTRDLARSLQSSMKVADLKNNLDMMLEAKTINIHQSKRSNGIGLKFTVSLASVQ